MILDTSALVAILYREPEAASFATIIHDADNCRISVANYVELAMVIESQLGSAGMRLVGVTVSNFVPAVQRTELPLFEDTAPGHAARSSMLEAS
ncbi:MAG: type II toxin-antitoxin system VapC family toxin [Pseudomonadota bacterium]|nr:type II toxin-antitoxin system VapC family toxin [Pseudomonadota bacterium]